MATGEARLYVDGAIDLGARTQYFSPGWGPAQVCSPTGCALQPGALGSIATIAPDSEGDPLIIGGEAFVNNLRVGSFFTGVIDELEYFNVALSSAQINAQFLAGSGPPPPPLDVTDPVVTLTTPAVDEVFSQGQAVNADYACSDEAGGSGLASCVGDLANGAAIGTSTLGAFSFTVTGIDNQGNSTIVTHDYTVTVQSWGEVSI